MLEPKDLSPQQVQAYKDILTKKRLCNTSECGFGKTISALTAFVVLKRKHSSAKALIVSNKKGVENAWSKEYKKWSHTKHLKLQILTGTPTQRLKKLEQDADAYVLTYHNLKWLLRYKKLYNFQFIIADEAECLKGPSSIWRRALTQIAPNAPYKYLLSATPKSREEDDYWGLCKYLDNGERLGKNITEFRETYMSPYTAQNRQLWRMKKTSVPVIESKIKDIFINYELSKQAKIPIKIITCKACLSDKSQVKYDLLEKEQSLNALLKTDEYDPLDALSVNIKLNQLSSGFLYVDEKIRIDIATLEKTTNFKKLKKQKVINVFNDRLNAFKRMLHKITQTHGNKPVAIWYHFKYELEQLKSILPAGIDDQQHNLEENWNAGKIPYLFLQYGRSARALNLQGNNIVALYSLTFKWAEDYQMVRRFARQGQKADKVYLYRLYLNGTLDDLKTRRLKDRFIGHTRFQKLIRKKYVR